jgi:acetate kinase
MQYCAGSKTASSLRRYIIRQTSRASSQPGRLWELEGDLNSKHGADKGGRISTDNSRVAVYVIPTNEELLIARDTVRVVTGTPQRF